MAATGLAEFFIGLGGGMAQGGLDSIIEKEKAAIQAARDEQLSRLRMQEHRFNKETDARVELETLPKKKAIETEAEIEKRKKLDPMDVDKSKATKRGEKEVEGEFLDQDVKRAGLVEGARSQAGLPASLAVTRAAGEEARRRDKENDDRREKEKWIVDGDGNYRRPDGSLVTEEIREGGKLLGTRPVKAPRTKVEGGRQELYSKEDEIKFIESEIKTIQGKQFKDESDQKELTRLRSERERLLGRAPKADAKPEGATTFSGKYTKDGKRIMQDAKGNKFVED